MKQVLKYSLTGADVQVIAMPEGSLICRVGRDAAGFPCLWAVVEMGAPPSCQRAFFACRDGEEVFVETQHVGSWLDSPDVVHLFEGPVPPSRLPLPEVDG